MNVLRCSEGTNSSYLQIWNNAAFDNGDSEDLSAMDRRSWSPLKSFVLNSSDSLHSFSSKENQSPRLLNTSLSSVKSPLPLPLRVHDPNGAIEENSRIKPVKESSKNGLVEKRVSRIESEGEVPDERKIDEEIEEIEMEISRLSSRLEALKIERAEKNVKLVEKRGRVVPAKLIEEKKTTKNVEELKKIDQNLCLSARTKAQRRGLSLGPAEIMAGARRGMSLGPSEISAGLKSRELGKKECMITPVQPIQNRRKSCFWKLQDIDEEKVVTKERGKSPTVSPKTRKNLVSKTQASRQVVTAVASKKNVKREEVRVNSVQPKKLFKDGEKPVPDTSKKPLRPGRVVASRYSQIIGEEASAMRKRSLPENDKDESKRCDKQRSLSARKSHESLPENNNSHESLPENNNLGTATKVKKKKWQIPSDLVIHSSESDDSSPTPTAIPGLLPRIRTTRCINETTPRDSGPAKRVADLIGRKPYFADDEEVVESSLRQALSFAEEDEVEEN